MSSGSIRGRWLWVVCLSVTCPLPVAAAEPGRVAKGQTNFELELAVAKGQTNFELVSKTAAKAAKGQTIIESVNAAGAESDIPPSSRQRRPGEASVAVIPSIGPAPEADEFWRLRSQLDQVRDPLALLDDVRDYVERHPQHRDARLLLGRVQILGGDQLGAIGTLSTLLQMSHPDWQPWFWTGTAYLSMGEFELAAQNLDLALRKNSRSVDVWVQMAVLEQEKDNHAGALQYLAIAEQIDPRAPQMHLNKGYSLERLGRYEEALRAYQYFLVSDIAATSVALRPTILRRIATIAGELEAYSRGAKPG